MASKAAPSSDMSRFRELLSAARHIIIITGAGISAESGVPTFRGAGGFWRKYNSQTLATFEAFRKSPSLVWEFYHYRRELVLTKKPNAAHLSIAKFEQKLRDEGKGRTLTLITQNVDGLHYAAGSRNVIEIHGSLFQTECLVCGNVSDNRDSPICPSLAGRGAPDLKEDLPEIETCDLPRCKREECNNGLLRPAVVWFGENLPEEAVTQTYEAMEKCDMCLVIGTSSVVYPAAMWAPNLAVKGATVAEFNLEKTNFTKEFHFHFQGPCAETVPAALGV